MSKKEALIDATKQLLWEKGYEATSPRDIQALSATGQGSFYHHFDGKKDLAIAALEEISREMLDIMRDNLAAKGPAQQRLESYLCKPRESLKGCRVGRLANEISMQDPQLGQPMRAYFEELTELLKHAIREAQEDGSLPAHLDAGDLATTLLAVVQGGFVLSRAQDRTDIHQSIARSMINLLFGGEAR
ncbi:TetR/AcrR family transcriptional regulator [Aestuariispira insulae]|uniref:TetR family transcriptional regulator n=1 Tax=Aestuariispira insulae TaxID=1461337 RepID=A0A3D9HXJ2_9PROT|nr:TetR/AcrR family transcriptional regulator [Aestuariispira insulae]RED54091.1 TetR family transcriptional regulator [Aestuariispira insulae]